MRPVARAILRRIQTPVISAALLILLIADAAVLAQDRREMLGPPPPGLFVSPRSTWRLWWWAPWRIRAIHLPRRGDWLFACRDGSGWRLFHANDPAIRDRPVIATVWYLSDSKVTGLWAFTRRQADESIEVRPWGDSAPTPEEAASIAAAFIASQPHLTRLDPGINHTDRTLWCGVAHNAASAAAATLWLVSVPWVLRFTRRHRRARRLAAGLCPKCAYDVRTGGLAVCPECGWGRDGP